MSAPSFPGDRRNRWWVPFFTVIPPLEPEPFAEDALWDRAEYDAEQASRRLPEHLR